jgi:hypothetical protein
LDAQLGESPLYELAAFGKRFAVLVEREHRRALRFHDIAGRHPPAEAGIPGDGGKPCAVSHVTPMEKTAYVACGGDVGRDRELTRPLLVALNLPSGKETWRYAIPGVAEKPCFVSRPRFFGPLMSLTVRTGNSAGPARHMLLKRGTGEAVFTYPACETEALPGRIWIRGLVMMNQRLILETDKGLLCIQGPVPE